MSTESRSRLCGELASEPIGALALIALGYRSLSLTPSAVGPVKAMVLDLDAAKAAEMLRSDDSTVQPAAIADPHAVASLCFGGRSSACLSPDAAAKPSSMFCSRAMPRSRTRCRVNCRAKLM